MSLTLTNPERLVNVELLDYFKQKYDVEVETLLADKQDSISDLSTIRSGAEAGATAYQKPSTGIPSTDLASAVQTSLAKADNAAPQSTTYTKTETDTLLNGKQDTINDLSTIRSGATAGASAYQKPNGGIPSTDLASAVQTTLGKADTAYQKPSGGIPSTDMASGVQTSLGKADSAYQKPSGGIPKTDLDSAVQTSLGKADAAAPQSTTYSKSEVDTLLDAKENTLTYDTAPAVSSLNPVTSAGIYAAIQNAAVVVTYSGDFQGLTGTTEFNNY